MALKIYLPLSGNVSDYGLGEATVSTTGSIVYTSGIFGGRCLSAGSGSVEASLESVPSAFAISMWFKGKSAGTLLGLGSDKIVGNASGEYSYEGSLVGNENLFTVDNGWNNLVLSADGTNVTVYLNGEAVYEDAAGASIASVFAGGFKVILGSYAEGTDKWTGNIANVRVYDNAISQKEAIEIAKGIVLHYTFNHSGFGNVNLLHMEDREVVVTGAEKAKYVETDEIYADLTAGVYTLSAKTDAEWATSASDAGTSDNLVALEIYQKSGDAVSDRTFYNMENGYVNITITTSGRYYLGIIKYSDGTTEKTATVSEIQLEAGSQASVWAPPVGTAEWNRLELGKYEFDVSGNGLHGSFSTPAPGWSADTGAYSGSYDFSNGSYVKSPVVDTVNNGNSFTVSVFAKAADLAGKILFGFDTAPRFNLSTIGGVFGIYDSETSQNVPFGEGESVAAYNGTWHQYTITGDGTKNTLYIDGEEIGSTSKYFAFGLGTIYVNGWDQTTAFNFNGLISDFRVYTRALTDDAIKAQFDQKAAVDNLGKIYASEFAGINISNTATLVSRTGVVTTDVITTEGSYDATQDKLIPGEDVTQAGIASLSFRAVDVIEL